MIEMGYQLIFSQALAWEKIFLAMESQKEGAEITYLL